MAIVANGCPEPVAVPRMGRTLLAAFGTFLIPLFSIG
jgi:hypothetical protein